jgi:hypothetical protein
LTKRLIDNREISKSDHVRNFLSANYKPDRKKFKPFEFGNEMIIAPNETLKRTQQKLVKTLSHFSGKKREPLSKVMSFLDPKKRHVSDVDDLEQDVEATSITAGVGMLPVDDPLSSSSEEFVSDEEDILSNTSNNPIVFAIIQVLVQIFDFKEQHAWLRDNAALSVLHQFLGNKGSVDASVNQLVKSFVSDETLIRFFKKYKEYMTKPSLQMKAESPLHSRIDAKSKVLAVYSGIFGSCSKPITYFRQ